MYAQPLISANAYSGFQELARPRTFDFTRYGRDNGSTISYADSTYTVDPDGPGGPAAPFQFTNPTFNIASLRGNAVLRWECLPGSTIFLVWTQNRSDTEDTGDFQFAHSLDRMLSSQANNIFLIKVTYWWNP